MRQPTTLAPEGLPGPTRTASAWRDRGRPAGDRRETCQAMRPKRPATGPIAILAHERETGKERGHAALSLTSRAVLAVFCNTF